MGDILTTELTFGRFGYGTATDTITGLKRKLLWIVDSSGQVSDSPFANPVITQTSAAGTNPPTWSAVMPDLQVGDRIQLDFTSNGTAPDGTAEETHDPVTSDEAINGDITWTTFTGFAASSTVKWRQRYGRTIGGTQIWSNWSNTLSDVVNAAPFAPADLFSAPDFGYAWDSTDLTKVFQNNNGTTAGVFGQRVGRLVDISGKNSHINGYDDTSDPTLQNVNNGLVQFDGANDKLLAVNGLYAKGSATLMFAIKITATAAVFLWSETSSVSANPLYAPGTRQLGTAGEDCYVHIRNDANTNVVTAAIDSNGFDNTIHILTLIDSGSVVTAYIDGISKGTQAYTRSATTPNQAFFGCQEPGQSGGNGSGSDFMNGSIGAGCIIGRVLGGPHNSAGSELNKLYNWIAGKHGLATL